jgi:hypothetical protein
MTTVAIGIAMASLVYGSSLVAQRLFPRVKELLEVAVGDGAKPTYYLRVIASLSIGTIGSIVGKRLVISERALTGWASVTIAVSLVLVCAWP